MKPGKAPGLDGIPMEAIKKLEEIAPKTILEPLNDILTKRNFPKDWKQAKLVLIPKGNAENMKFRPICLLNSISKALGCKETSSQKSEAVILKGQRGKEEIKFMCDDVEIPRKNCLVYLALPRAKDAASPSI
ncbi:hypothetical protein JTB14_019955 [Gonioctena quinquepunctata]|nr:hypothetical protein JTB14_019955 [Gonioctena quinquepunctata]